MSLLNEAKTLLALMDDVEVFPRYEFEGLRAAVAEAESTGWTWAQKRRLLISVVLFACSLGATWFQWRASEHLRDVIGRQQEAVEKLHEEKVAWTEERRSLLRHQMGPNPKIRGIARVRSLDGEVRWEALVDIGGDWRCYFVEVVGAAKEFLEAMANANRPKQ